MIRQSATAWRNDLAARRRRSGPGKDSRHSRELAILLRVLAAAMASLGIQIASNRGSLLSGCASDTKADCSVPKSAWPQSAVRDRVFEVNWLRFLTSLLANLANLS